MIVAWSPPCGECAYCGPRHQPNLCLNIQMVMGGTPHFRLDGAPVFGMAGAGTFAEEMIIPHQGVVKIDDDIPLEIGSLVGCGVMTGVGAAINTAKVTPAPRSSCSAAVASASRASRAPRSPGPSVILAVDLNDGKLEDAKRFGATHSCKPDEVDSLKATLTGGDGFDYSFEAIGLPTTMRASYDAIRRGGTACIVGVGKLDEFVSVQRLRALLLGEEPRRLLLRLRRRPHRLPQAPGLLEGGQARPRRHDHAEDQARRDQRCLRRDAARRGHPTGHRLLGAIDDHERVDRRGVPRPMIIEYPFSGPPVR